MGGEGSADFFGEEVANGKVNVGGRSRINLEKSSFVCSSNAELTSLRWYSMPAAMSRVQSSVRLSTLSGEKKFRTLQDIGKGIRPMVA